MKEYSWEVTLYAQVDFDDINEELEALKEDEYYQKCDIDELVEEAVSLSLAGLDDAEYYSMTFEIRERIIKDFKEWKGL